MGEHQALERVAPLAERHIAQVAPARLQQIVRDEGRRRVGQHAARERLAADALLQDGKRRERVVA